MMAILALLAALFFGALILVAALMSGNGNFTNSSGSSSSHTSDADRYSQPRYHRNSFHSSSRRKTSGSNHYDPARDEYRFDDPIREDEEGWD